MYTISRLTQEQLPHYANLTFPSIQDELLSEQRKQMVVAVGASLLDRPIGLIWGNYWPEHGLAQIRTIFLIPRYRGKGIGTDLLREMEQALMELGCRDVQFSYRQGHERSLIWERLFRQQNWGTHAGSLHSFTVSTSDFMELPWVRQWALSDDFSFFTWGELNDGERAVIRSGLNDWYPAVMTPFRDDKWMDPNLSVGLRHGKEIVGWMIIHTVEEKEVIGDCLFARHPYQAQGRAISVMIEAVRRIVKADYPVAQFQVSGNNKQMLRLVERRMKPCVKEENEIVRMNKRLVAIV